MTRPAVDLPVLTDGRVLLRPATEGDLPAIEAGQQDPDVVRWIGPPWPADEVLARNAARWADGSPALAICEPDGSFVGLVWVNVRDTDRATGFVGYWLLPVARGRGLATAAVRLMSSWALVALGLQHLRLTTDPDNEPSQRVAERSGFERAGVNDEGQMVFELVEQSSGQVPRAPR